MNKKPVGRPSKYSEELAIIICEEIARGGILHRMCEREDLPDHSTLYRWLEGNEQFRDMYARAREKQAEFFADEIIEIADESGFDAKIVDGKIVADHDAVNRAKLRVDARKWHASKTAPKKYGDRLQQVLTDPDGAALKVQQISPLEEIEARLARLSERHAETNTPDTTRVSIRKDINQLGLGCSPALAHVFLHILPHVSLVRLVAVIGRFAGHFRFLQGLRHRFASVSGYLLGGGLHDVLRGWSIGTRPAAPFV